MSARMLTFSRRCAREILRDPLNIAFGLGFPIALLLLLSAIQSNIPVPLFEIESLAPGIAVFGLSFMSLFSATLIARDRESAFLERLYTTPLRPAEFILGYMLPLLPIALAQVAVSYLTALALGLRLSVGLLLALVCSIPSAILYISLGLLCGSLFNVKQVGGICGALLTNLSAWLSGIWFDISLVGEGFVRAAKILPFIHAVELSRAALSGGELLGHLWPLLLWSIGIAVLAVSAFVGCMRRR